jgi:hypothetical protein
MYRIYYQYNSRRLPVCTLPVHALLHIADDIRRAGPVWCYWAFAMERYYGSLVPSVKSKRHLYASIARRIRETTQLGQMKLIYNKGQELELSTRKDYDTTGTSFFYCEYSLAFFYMYVYSMIYYPDPDLLMVHPNKTTGIDSALRRKIAAHIVTNYPAASGGTLTISEALAFVPNEISEWAKLKLRNSKETIHAAHMVQRSDEDARDATFVRVRLGSLARLFALD